MTVLSDKTILERMNMDSIPNTMLEPYQKIVIEPFDIKYLQGASYDIHLGNKIIDDMGHEFSFETSDFHLPPGRACLAHTLEKISTPHDCVIRVEGNSTQGRKFIIIHCTAGWCDPGFVGNITLELVNHGREPFVLHAGMRIAQITFLQLDQPAERVYKGRYQNAQGVEAAKP